MSMYRLVVLGFLAAPSALGCTIVNNTGADAAPGADTSTVDDSTVPDSDGADMGADASGEVGGDASDAGSDATGAEVSTGPSGALDPSFGTGGLVTYDPSTSEDQTEAIALQGDGKLAVTGYVMNASGGTDFALARFDRSGALDTSFGTGGLVTLDTAYSDFAADVVLASDGKIILLGNGDAPIAARFTAAGALDTTFATKGWETIALPKSKDTIRKAVATPDGHLVGVGITSPTSSTFDTIFVSLSSDGSLDSTFGTGGLVTPFPGTKNNLSRALVRGSDGSLYAAGNAGKNVLATKLGAHGAVDLSYGTSGLASATLSATASTWAAALQSDGKLVIAANSGSPLGISLIRLNAAGQLDATFGTGGIASTTKSGVDLQAYAIALQPDGKIVVAGFTDIGDAGRFVVLRYTASGVLDTAFGSSGDGTATAAFPAPNHGDFAIALALRPEGPIVVGGYRYLEATPSTGSANAAWGLAQFNR